MDCWREHYAEQHKMLKTSASVDTYSTQQLVSEPATMISGRDAGTFENGVEIDLLVIWATQMIWWCSRTHLVIWCNWNLQLGATRAAPASKLTSLLIAVLPRCTNKRNGSVLVIWCRWVIATHTQIALLLTSNPLLSSAGVWMYTVTPSFRVWL